MRIPVLFEFTTRLLVNFLFYIELSFVEHSDVVCENCHLNLWSLSAVEGRLPPLDEEARDHNIVPWLDKIDKVVLKDHNGGPRDHSRLQRLVHFLYLDLLVVLVLGCPVDRHKEPIIALADSRAHIHHPVRTLLLSTSSLLHLDNHLLEGVRLFLDLASADGRQEKP